MFHYIGLAVLLVLLHGCSFNPTNKYQRYADFPVNKNLVLSEEIDCDSVFLHYPYRVEIKDSLAVILDLHPESCFLHAFAYPEGGMSPPSASVEKGRKRCFLPNV